ncbi:UNVERIFIED_CONTAM: hypothetical protein H355_016594 [Colinus virginianus]|nr:hypothetical protein H355_016594 [Colinus virginianus]
MLSGEEVLGEPSLHPAATTEHGHPITHGQLPPLRQTWYGRASAGPLDFNTPPENGASSIIKLHPPRRPQGLEVKTFSLSLKGKFRPLCQFQKM